MFRVALSENPMFALTFASLWLALVTPAPGQGVGSVTLLDGSLRVIRGTAVFQGAEGMSVKQGDILESSAAAFVQLEFTDGPIIALGPSSRMYVLQQTVSETGSAHAVSLDLVMLSGWFKGESAVGKKFYRYRSPMLSVTTMGGTVVVRSDQKACDIFVESGSASIGELSQNGSSRQTIEAKVGQFFSRQKGVEVIDLPRPSPAFLDSMPRQFRDTLPPRLAHLSGKSVEIKPGHPVSYDEIEPWLTIPSTWRRGLAQRFAPRLSDAEFRNQIQRHVNEFPEWDPILHPK
jgi:hypothetical protein